MRLCLKGECRPVVGNALHSEYEDVISRGEIRRLTPISAQQIRELMNALYSVSDWVPIYFLFRPNLKDEADNHIFELAIAGQASHIVTNNIRDFKDAQLQFPEIEILSPDKFLGGYRHGDIDD